MNYKNNENILEKRHVKDAGGKSKGAYGKDVSRAQYMRAPNEDDDGYDPYSDRPADTPLFEENPWD